ncbi:unnamed protein product [Rotaria sordida]|uniref:Uncharacterized protein n=1 Tax=Rotaria sordida TaxID=392033 RepID=A0A813VYA6_9BILA|nr:unnamed protein product [Rotaria sordida]CAF1224406.1 unnamed protein product [Rotaria sordida]CAF1244703.1 unnamed protein product [Rotaria sordida]
MIRSNILIIIKSKEDIVNNELKNSQITTIEQNQRISRTLSRTDIQFKLITYHNTEYHIKYASICVPNLTLPIDVIILPTDNSFSMIEQNTMNFSDFLQKEKKTS